jgi:ATP-dependent Lon protease
MSPEDERLDIGDASAEHPVAIPSELPILPLRDTVLFPNSFLPLAVARESSVRLIEEAISGSKLVGVFTQRDASIEEPAQDDLHRIGTATHIHKMFKLPDGSLRLIVQGLSRLQLESVTAVRPYLRARVNAADDVVRDEDRLEIDALQRNIKTNFQHVVSLSPLLSDDLQALAMNITEPGRLADFIASSLATLSTAVKQEVLETVDVRTRLDLLNRLLIKEAEVLELGSKIQSQVQSEMEKGQREYFLRQQLKAIQAELGEGDPELAEVNELRERLEELTLPEDVQKVADRELSRLERIPQAAAEYGVIRTYLEWIITLPWEKFTEDNLDLDHGRKILDEDHFDLEKVKDRIVEHLAVAKLRNKVSGQILCFVGPPGVGKTSLGQSIARALGRKFVRMSVGGVRDESEIRGHRRTYIGALPGRLVRALRDAGTMNPVILLDEVDKLGHDWRGDPSSALLEVLDPAQNHNFQDHYLDVPLDLSHVMFIATANVADSIPGPLLDRMEVIRFDGYTTDEKVHIARGYLWPRQVERNGLVPEDVTIENDLLRLVVNDYTREAGVRQLERELGTVLRKTATRVATGDEAKPIVIDAAALKKALGRPKFVQEAAARTAVPGVATGLAVTGTGGDVLFIEGASMAGKGGGLVLTGQLGDVMKESARIALTYVRSHAEQIGIDDGAFADREFHVHVPAGAIPKDGPSAGITMVTALASLLTGRTVKSTVGMTGEVTLQGRVLPIGGLKQKVLAAHAAGLTEVILPERNAPDLDDVPADVRDQMTFHPVASIEQVLEIALDPKQVALAA